MSSIFKVLAFIPSDILKDTDDKIYIGKVINSYSENQEKYIIILLNSEKGDIRQLKNVPIETMKLLALWNQTKFVIINHSFYGKYSKRKERQLKKIIELSKEDPTLLISYSAPFEKFFKDKHFYNDVIKTYHKRIKKCLNGFNRKLFVLRGMRTGQNTEFMPYFRKKNRRLRLLFLWSLILYGGRRDHSCPSVSRALPEQTGVQCVIRYCCLAGLTFSSCPYSESAASVLCMAPTSSIPFIFRRR